MGVDVAQEAKRIVDSLKQNGKISLTTSQIRKFLSAVNRIENRMEVAQYENGGELDELPPDLVAEIRMLKVKLVYQAGRSSVVKDFLIKSGLDAKIDDVGNDPAKFKNLARLVEAIVAYHRFEGGKD